MKKRNITSFVFLFSVYFLVLANTFKTEKTDIPIAFAKEKLSEYGFFEGNMAEMQPTKDVIPYSLNSPLFSDYAYKLRFIKIPSGEKAVYNSKDVFQFPVGTVLIKTFYYPFDFKDEKKGRRLLETRLLIHEEKGWIALPYIWNEEQSEAYLEVAGGEKEITWKDEKGKKQKLNYSIPNVNQCKGCHNTNERLTPIGPTARQLNGDFMYKEGKKNQLLQWKESNLLANLPDNSKDIPQFPLWDNPATGNLESRARAYLDVNCGHCHKAEGPAKTSGLFLDIHEKNPTALGIYKAPVAAGRGSGDRKFSIVPGNPDASILIYRMESADPGVMMPELSQRLIHKEGIQLIREWIKTMNPKDYTK